MRETNDYIKLVIPQHRKPKYINWLKANLNVIEDTGKLIGNIDSSFNLDNATGLQLDITGNIIGRSRLLSFEPYNETKPLLNDDLYRILQKAKISINQWDGTIPGVLELWENLFPDYKLIIQDNQDMTLTLYIVGRVTETEKELISRGYIAPKPEGVRINYEFNYEEDTHCTLYHGVSFSMSAHYIFYPHINVNYDVHSSLSVGSVFDISKELLMYERYDREYDLNGKTFIGSGFTASKELTMYQQYNREYDINGKLLVGSGYQLAKEIVMK